MKDKKIIAWKNLQISALNTVTEDYSKYIRKLEKENAELKEDNKVMSDNYSKMEQKFYNNLFKAKELLKWALHSDPEHDEDFEKKWEEAEQFLKQE